MLRTKTTVVLAAALVAAAGLAGGLGYLALTIEERDGPGVEEMTATVDAESAVQDAHEAGITGENVSVGVIDVTGFDTDHPVVDPQVSALRHFESDPPAGANDRHGTATAATVGRIAPDADLYLATFETPDEYATALEWMIERDVDVVIAPVADAGTLGDGSSRLSQATTNATERGVVVVAPAGNLGDAHWAGTYRPTESGVHTFDDGPVNEISGEPGRGEFWLVWDDPGETYRLELHRLDDDGTTERLAQSVPHGDETVPSERLTVGLGDERYGLVVRGPDAGSDVETRLRIASSTHSLSTVRRSGSVTAPAAAPGALSVGAFDPATGTVKPFSSRGPTPDGRLGVDVVAPGRHPVSEIGSFDGTSASAAFAGGVAALVVDVNSGLDPTAVRRIVTSTGEPVDGVDTESGYGRIDPAAAIDEAAERAETPPE